MKVGFTSCCDTDNDAVQSGWTHLATQRPDHVVMLGDNIYMDYALGPHPMRLGEPKGLSLGEFSDMMHRYYTRQWMVETFRAMRANQPVYAIWDDHDFGWNNAWGGGTPSDAKEYMPADYRRLSRALFQQFRDSLIGKPLIYPPNPYPHGVVPNDLGGIQSYVDLVRDEVRLHLLDGRSFREAPGRRASLLGGPQRDKLAANWLPEPAINLVASGTTLKDWDQYADGDWLKGQGQSHRIIVLSGDIHKPRFDNRGRVFEATASALAQPPGITSIWPLSRRTGIYGIVTIDVNAIDITLYELHSPVKQMTIDRHAWKAL